MNRRLFVMVLLLLALLWVSTRNGEESGDLSKTPKEGDGAGRQVVRVVRRVVIKPDRPDLLSVLRVDVETDPVTFDISVYRYRWFVNKKEISRQATLSLAPFHQGDLVSVEVTLSSADDVPPSSQAAASVKIGNNPPVIKTIRLLPMPVSAGDDIRVEVTSEDVEGDFVHFNYEWQVNQQPIQENDRDRLSGDQVHSADRIMVFVTPSDPFSKGTQQVSSLITVSNRSPMIESFPPRQDEGVRYRYQVVAKDLDRDPLHYALLEGPPGMKIDPVSGLIDWEIVSISKSAYVRIEVDDEKGGKVMQEFTIQTSPR